MLTENIALVTGASRGIGKEVAIALAAAGATVYATARTTEEGTGVDGLSGSINETIQQINDGGGKGIAIPCDHCNDREVAAVFDQIENQQGRIDILVNNVWGGYETLYDSNGDYVWEQPFWKQPITQWDTMFAAGVRAHWITSHHAAKLMVAQQSGLIVNISHWAGRQYSGNVCYGVSKAATDRLTSDTAHDLSSHGVAVVSLYPGLVRTERVMKIAEFLDMSNSESPEFIGKVISALAADTCLMEKSGKVMVAAQLALDYGICDIDGKQPRVLTLDEM